MNKFIQFFIVLALTLFWIITLNNPIGKLPVLGSFFSPKTGFWMNAENKSGAEKFIVPKDSLEDSVLVLFNDRMVPQIIAKSDRDLYFMQGYTHAHFRLWQMDFYSRYASGRLSEVFGIDAFDLDREQRRKGMLWAAEAALKSMEKDPETKLILDAYTSGINTYIKQLRYHYYPIEFKLLNYTPEKWTNLKTMLVFKMLTDDLTGYSKDIDYSLYRNVLSNYDFDFLFPNYNSSAIPSIEKDWPKARNSKPRTPAANIYSDFSQIDFEKSNENSLSKIPLPQEHAIGSNNWVVGMEKTMFDNVLLANDPHLGLSMPNIWIEMQLSSYTQNVYGVSLPGVPSIIIGHNDDIAWGVTNHYADVKDYYEIFPNDNWTSYSFDQEWVPFNIRYEKIKILNAEDFIDTVYYTIHGPVIFDRKFEEPRGSGKNLAMTWKGHSTNNELKALIQVNKSRNFDEFKLALNYFSSPAQNFIYGDIDGNIGLVQAGAFPNKFNNQGRFVMLGNTSETLWKEDIPIEDRPILLNPDNNFLSTANNTPVDKSYPYNLYGDYVEMRNRSIQSYLKDSSLLSVANMKHFQNSNKSFIAKDLEPLFIQSIENLEDADSMIKSWAKNFQINYAPTSSSITAFHIWHQIVYHKIWDQHFSDLPTNVRPSLERTIQLMLHYPRNKYFEYMRGNESINLAKIMEESLIETRDSMQIIEKEGRSEWYAYKNTQIKHLLNLDAFSYLDIPNGGWSSALNATTQDSGPSWRMIVNLNPHSGVQAIGIKPGGQSGNPGSIYYNIALDTWINGEYFDLPFINRETVNQYLKAMHKEKVENSL